MSLVVHQKPQELTPGYNDQIFVALSSQIAQPDFKYVVTVIVNGDTAHAYTEEFLQRPDGRLVFNAMEWVRNYIAHYFNPLINLASPIEIATNKCVRVEVNVNDYHTGAIDTTVTNYYTAFDACLTDADFRNYVYTNYTFKGATGKYFLSKTTNTITPDSRIVIGQDVWLHTIFNAATPIDTINITQKHGASTVQVVNIAAIPTPGITYEMYVIQAGTKIMTAPVVGDTITVDFLVGAVSHLRWTYTIQDVCSKFTDYVLHYLDRDGNVLHFHFEYKSTQNFTKKTNEVKLEKDTLNTATNQYGSNTWDREEHVISTSTESTITVNTGWITEAQSLALLDLFDSPIRYVWDGTKLRSCKITNNSFETKLKANEKLFNYECTIDLGITEPRQRGI